MDYETAQLYVPIMDFIARYELFKQSTRNECMAHLSRSGLPERVFDAVIALGAALEAESHFLPEE